MNGSGSVPDAMRVNGASATDVSTGADAVLILYYLSAGFQVKILNFSPAVPL